MRFFVVTLLILTPTLAAAQQMDEGEARITARSDVRMEIATGPGTPRAELQTIGAAVGQRLAAVRACYAERVEQDPSVRGTLVVRVAPKRNGRAEATVQRDGLEDAALRTCSLDALAAASVRDAQPTSSIIVTFTFTNSAAEGRERMENRRAASANVTIESEPDGRLASSGGPESGQLRYRVIGAANQRDSITSVHGAVRAATPGLLDCRRRAMRRNADPAGEIRVELTVGANGRARAGRTQSTVAEAQSGRCVATVLTKAEYPREAAGRYTIVVTNAPSQ